MKKKTDFFVIVFDKKKALAMNTMSAFTMELVSKHIPPEEIYIMRERIREIADLVEELSIGIHKNGWCPDPECTDGTHKHKTA
jgi:hypothetical protein